MRTWAIFFYGTAIGVLAAWALAVLVESTTSRWLLIGAAVALAVGLILHQRHVSLSKGRRWRKTT